MEKGLPYDVFDNELQQLEAKARRLLYDYNHSAPEDTGKKVIILSKLFGKYNSTVHIVSNFMCIFGYNIYFEGSAVINCNCTMLDSATIHLGENIFVGPGTCFASSLHPLVAEERNSGICYSKPIIVGKNVWIGANCTILGGVSIGDNSVIGAGSVVSKNIPSGVIAVGTPCRVLREITEKDKMM